VWDRWAFAGVGIAFGCSRPLGDLHPPFPSQTASAAYTPSLSYSPRMPVVTFDNSSTSGVTIATPKILTSTCLRHTKGAIPMAMSLR
jgi:hypothetical protein